MANRPTGRQKTVGPGYVAKDKYGELKGVWKKDARVPSVGGVSQSVPAKKPATANSQRGSGGAARIIPPKGNSYRVITHNHGKEIKFK